MGRRLKNEPVIDKVQLNVKVPKALKGNLDKIAIAKGRDLVEIVNEALAAYAEAIAS